MDLRMKDNNLKPKYITLGWGMFLIMLALLLACNDDAMAKVQQVKGAIVKSRFAPPKGFIRSKLDSGSFEEYLRKLPLKPFGASVHLYDGSLKYNQDAHSAVVDLPIGKRDLHQCADAVMRLRAEYLWKAKRYEEIHFNFTNGFNCQYSKWRQGFRIRVKDNKANWVKTAKASDSYASFWKYMEMVFAYAGSLSLSKELKSVPIEQMKIGDAFVIGGSPGHCAIVIDMCENLQTGQKMFLLAQSYMPAQETHVLKNEKNAKGESWYPLNFGETLDTPEYEFTKDDLMRFGI